MVGTYPNYEQVIPHGDDHDIHITFDAKLLWEMAQAMGVTTVRLRLETSPDPREVNDPMKPMLVEANDGSGAFGVLMPIRTS